MPLFLTSYLKSSSKFCCLFLLDSSPIQPLLITSTLNALTQAPSSLSCLLPLPPVRLSVSMTAPFSLFPTACQNSWQKTCQHCILPLLKTFSVSHFTQRLKSIQRPARRCMISFLPLLSSLNILTSLLPQGLCMCCQGC